MDPINTATTVVPPRPPRNASRSHPHTPLSELSPTFNEADFASSSSEDEEEAVRQQWARERRMSSLFTAMSFDQRRESLSKLANAQHPYDDLAENDTATFLAQAIEPESDSDLFTSADEGFSMLWSNPPRNRSSLIGQNVLSQNMLEQVIQAEEQSALDGFEKALEAKPLRPRLSVQSVKEYSVSRQTSSPSVRSSIDSHPSASTASVSPYLSSPQPSLTHSFTSSRTSLDSQHEYIDKANDPTPKSEKPAISLDIPLVPFQSTSPRFPDLSDEDVVEQKRIEKESLIREKRRRSKSVITVPEVDEPVLEPVPGLNIRPNRRRSRTADELPQNAMAQKDSSLLISPAQQTWRSTISDADFASLKSTYGPLEMRRQEVIWELCQTEEDFVNSMAGVSKLFFLPLRTPQGQWIKGIPSYITRLLDWFDDIAHLHAQLSRALRLMQWRQQKVVLKVAETILPFIEHLEVHQPYLARFEAIAAEIDEAIADGSSDFGEFIRMQQDLPQCGRMTLSSFLLKPVQRLMKYPLFFKQLCEMTPPSHRDHLATLTLLHCTDSVIRIMQEVKAREDEYEGLKTLQASLRGLPPNFQIAKRDRKMLASGSLRRLHFSDKERNMLHYQAMSEAHELRRGESFKIGTSSPLLTPLSPSSRNSSHGSLRDLLRTAEPTPRSSPMANSKSLPRDEKLRPPLRHSSSGLLKTKAKESSIHVFVLSDMAIFARKEENTKFGRKGDGKAIYHVLEGCGVCRVLGVEDLSGRTEHDSLMEVDLLPVSSEDELSAISLCNASLATSIYLSLNENASSPLLTAPRSKQSVFAPSVTEWLQAFQRSFFTALKSLSYPSNLSAMTSSISRRDVVDLDDDEDGLADDKRISYASLLASGLPFPKSPSQQIQTARDKAYTRLSQKLEVVEEREERAFWALRYRRMRKELQMDEAANMEARIVLAGTLRLDSGTPISRINSSMSLRGPALKMSSRSKSGLGFL